MATPDGTTVTGVTRQLIEQPYRFDFFQAVRLMERIARERYGEPDPDGPTLADVRDDEADEYRPADQPPKFNTIGRDSPPNLEVVRMRALPSRSFPASDIYQLKMTTPLEDDEFRPLFDLTVSFMGLYGPKGVLPTHYTQTVINETRAKRRSPTRDFLDAFNHRIISLFYRAWEKYRFEIGFERARNRGDGANDLFTDCLFSLVGMGPKPLRKRLQVPDDLFLFYAGTFSTYPKNAVSLERMLVEIFGLPIKVVQFAGQWLQLDPDQQSRMPTRENPDGVNAQLGLNFVAGTRVWSIDSKLRIRIGPVRYKQFKQLMPGQKNLVQLAQIVRQYVGPTLDFDVQVVLAKEDVPKMKFDSADRPQLGQNTWLFAKPLPDDKDEAVFRHDGWPQRK
jgi:type VI secretion system protein ImpH